MLLSKQLERGTIFLKILIVKGNFNLLLMLLICIKGLIWCIREGNVDIQARERESISHGIRPWLEKLELKFVDLKIRFSSYFIPYEGDNNMEKSFGATRTSISSFHKF